jgi:energy-coupling factor transporter ATP-binding protein EcfA2|nr:ATP-binding cassette domain-containing protein [Candidatus Krumholzibacteria bacterium]
MAAAERPLLQLRGWSLERRTETGSRPILEDVDLDLHAGRSLAVLGNNGSGKSSLLKYLASDESPLSDSRAIMFQDPDDQIIAPTVIGELQLGRTTSGTRELLKELGLSGAADLDPRLLSAGQKQRLVLGVVLQSDPQVLFCDEPTALQDPEQARWVLDRLQAWRRQPGRTLVTATCDWQDLDLADDLLVLDQGRVVLAGPVAEAGDAPQVLDVLGPRRVELATPAFQGDPEGPGFLRVAGLAFQGHSAWRGLANVHLELAGGQVMGVVGPNGCGKSTLLAACVGARKPDAGTISLGDHVLYGRGQTDLDHGLAMLAPQFPEYLFTRSTVAQEIALDPGLATLGPGPLLDRLGLPPEVLSENPHALSTGQKRRLALGLVLFSGRKLLVLDEPTAALDHAGRQLVLDLIRQVPHDSAVLMASNDRPFLAELGCPRLEMGDLSP